MVSASTHRPGSPLAEGPTLEGLRTRREEILRIAAQHGAGNVRVFGSVARGDADANSDVGILVDIKRDVRGFAYFGLLEDLRRGLSSVLSREVDIVDSQALDTMRERVLREAVPL
jgi:predicted nucleotidyltransferase